MILNGILKGFVRVKGDLGSFKGILEGLKKI